MNYIALKKAIRDSGLQRKDIALQSNITPKTIDNILAGADPKVSTLESIARVVGVSMSTLFDENSQIRQAQRDYVEKGNIEHHGIEYNNADAVLSERVKSLEALVDEKNERISELKERIEELKR